MSSKVGNDARETVVGRFKNSVNLSRCRGSFVLISAYLGIYISDNAYFFNSFGGSMDRASILAQMK
jgi:hypothetical protein